jgi:hypothetical protein
MLATRCSCFGLPSNRTAREPPLVGRSRVTLHFLKRHVARPGRNLMCATAPICELRAASRAQSMKGALAR